MPKYIVLIFIFFSLFAFACTQRKEEKGKFQSLVKEGYIIYFTDTRIRFVETKSPPNSEYIKNLQSDNIVQAFYFRPDSEINNAVSKIVPDTLIDENPYYTDSAPFLRQALIFPAKITYIDSSKKKDVVLKDSKKFKLLNNGKEIEIKYSELKGLVLDVSRKQ